MKKLTRWQHLSTVIIFIAVLVSALGLKLWQWHWPTSSIVLRGETLDVLVAKTPAHWYRGLGKRDNLGDSDGMLFLFPEAGRHGIVMRDMRFPIDIVWIEQGVVVDIAPRVQLEPGVEEKDLTVYYPRTDASVVLELPAGWADKHGLMIGGRVEVLEE